MLAALDDPLILTVLLDPASQAHFEGLRRRYFPPSRNLIPAHVTMFHHLPGDQGGAIAEELRRSCATLGATPFHATGVRFLGRGSALLLEMEPVVALRARLAAAWRPWLTAQDRQRWQPHVTVQNKCAPDVARQTFEALTAAFAPVTGMAHGVELWWYRQGPWEPAGQFRFAERQSVPGSLASRPV